MTGPRRESIFFNGALWNNGMVYTESAYGVVCGCRIVVSMLDKKDVLFITPTLIKGFSVRGGEMEERISLPWTPERAKTVLGTVRSALGKSVRLLVGESFAYVATLPLPPDQTFSSPAEERAEVKRLAGQRIPEDMDAVSWDYREVALPSESHPGRAVQVVALTASFGNTVSSAILESGFRVSAVEPESSAVARLLADRDEPILLVFRGETVFVSGVIRGTVLSSMTSIARVNLPIIETVARFLEHSFHQTPKTIVFAGEFSDSDLGDFDREAAMRAGFALEFSAVTAIRGIAEKEDISGDDRTTLSVELILPKATLVSESGSAQELPEVETERFRTHALDERSLSGQSSTPASASFGVPRRTVILAISFFFVALFGGGAMWFFLNRQSERDRSATRSEPIPPVPIEAPLPIPDENSSVSESSESREESLPESSEAPAFNRASFRVSIENAGGAPGSAGKLREKLVTEGFVVLSAGNAVSKSNASLLRSKASVPEEFLNDLVAVSKISSSNEMLRNIPDDAESDVIVTIGTESVESAL